MIGNLLANEYFRFFLIIAIALIGAKIVLVILINSLHRFAKKTKTDIDDFIIHVITKPFYAAVILVGFHLGLKTLTVCSAYVQLINNIFFIAYVFLVASIFASIFSELISRWFKKRKKYAKTPWLFNKVVSIIVYIIGILVILNYFNIQITPVVATLGIGGIAVGLALQNTLTNFFAGLHIISERPVDVGDFIEVNGLKGYVEDVGWRSTRIRTLPNTIIWVPNSKLAESTIINNSHPVNEMSVVLQCGVAYDSDLKKVEKVTVDVAKKIQKTVQGAVNDFEPFIRYHTFGDSNINFSIILRVETFVDRYLVSHEFIKALKERYDKEKIEISWPVRKIYQGK